MRLSVCVCTSTPRTADVYIPSLSRSKAVANDYRHSTGVNFEPNEHAADGVTAGQARHNSSNVKGVTAGHNSSCSNYVCYMEKIYFSLIDKHHIYIYIYIYIYCHSMKYVL